MSELDRSEIDLNQKQSEDRWIYMCQLDRSEIDLSLKRSEDKRICMSESKAI